MQLGQVECAVLGDPRFCQSSILLRSFSKQIVGLLVEGFLVDLLLSLAFGVVAVAQVTGSPVSSTLLKTVAIFLCSSIGAYLISYNSTLSGPGLFPFFSF